MSDKRALIVDDSTTAQYRLKKMLQSYDLDIDIVDSGEAALLYLAKHVPDVIFMDHLMPGMDGFRVLQIIKSHPETAMVPVIMYTSKSGDVYTGQARALGAMDVITKDTINTVELSKVMSGIHITPRESQPVTPLEKQEKQPISQPMQPVGPDNSRRIELRIVQLEHAIDDSRRVGAAQLVREMQKLRHGLKQEMASQLSKLLKEKNTTEETEARVTPATPTPWFTRVALLIGLVLLVTLMVRQGQLHKHFDELQAQQQPQQEILNRLSNYMQDMQVDILNQQQLPGSGNPPAIRAAGNLEDFVWAFNQNGQLAFSPRLVEAAAVVRVSDFLTRLARQGFKGSLWINLTVGNFCVQLDSYGQAQLPNSDVTLNQCMLLSEVYPLDGMTAQLVEEIHDSLASNPAIERGDIQVIVSQIENQSLSYPPRDAPLLASEWNKIAHGAHRLTLAIRSLPEE